MFRGKVLIGIKEAGGAAYFAALMNINKVGIFRIFAYPKAAKVFSDLEIPHELVTNDKHLSAKEIIESFDPDKILISLSPRNSLEKQFLIEGKRKGKPVFVLIDSYLNLWQRFANEKGTRRWHYLPDRIYVISEFARRRIIDQGAPKHIVFVLKHPLLHRSLAAKPEVPILTRKSVCLKLGIPEYAKIILFVSEYRLPDSRIWQWDQPSRYDLDFLLRITVKAASILTKECGVPCFVILKQHPVEKTDRIKKLSTRQRKFCRSISSVDKASLLDSADIVTGLTSILLSEAVERNKIVFSYHHFPSDKTTWFSTINTKIREMESKEACLGLLLKTLLPK